MVFKFIKYTQPAWQFNITPKSCGPFASCSITEEKLNNECVDNSYQTQSAKLADTAYSLWNKGELLQSTAEELKQLEKLPEPTLYDEYIFVQKYWGTAWVLFALLIRLITFKNIFKEIKAFRASRNIKQVNAYNNPVKYKDYETFESSLIKSNPSVAVIIPTLNRYQYLKDALHDLENQSYKNFMVIVVDQSEDFNGKFYNQFSLDIHVYSQKEKKLWTARNSAVKQSKEDYLLFFDDDSRVAPNWIYEHLKCIDFFTADISAGVSLAEQGQKIPANYSFFRWADQFDSGNAMVKRTVFKSIGLFDEQFNGMRMGDGEFGLRAYINGFKSISNPKASRIHLKAGTGGLREMGSWDGFRPKKWFAPKPVPSVIYLYKKYFPKHLYKNAILIGIILSNIFYKHKRSRNMLLLSVALSIIKSPLLYIQYCRSKKIANKMLQSAGAI